MIALRPFERLKLHWAETDCEVAVAPASEEEVRSLERRYDVRLPEDFRDYLLNTAPLGEYYLDDADTSWWSLARIRNIPDECASKVRNPEIAPDASKYIFFADFLIWSWAWAIACTEDENRGRIAVIGTSDDRFVAPNFAAFVDQYVRDPSGVY